MKINSTRIFIFAALFMLIGAVKNSQAQNEAVKKPLSERIDETAKKLQLKLVLSNEQLKKIDSILVQSIPKSTSKENREETIKLINLKIETVLTTKQLSKFAILKSKWLDEILSSTE
jgi:hypothetical protein